MMGKKIIYGTLAGAGIGAAGGYAMNRTGKATGIGALIGALAGGIVSEIASIATIPELKTVSEPYWDGEWVRIDYEMQDPDLTECPAYPTGYCYFYRGEPWIDGVCQSVGGGQMYPPDNLGPTYVLFAGEPGDVVTLKLAKIDRRDLSIVTYPDEVERIIPEP